MTGKKKVALWCAILTGSLLLGGCGAKSASLTGMSQETASAPSWNAAYDMAVAEVEVEEMGKGSFDGSFSSETTADSAGDVTLYEAEVQRKLIRTVNLDVQTVEFDTLLSYLEERVKALGGYIENSSVNGNGYYYDNRRYADLTIRIPAASLDGFVEGIDKNANVTYKSERAEDITLQYVDVESRVKSLQIEQERLFELLEKADSLDSIVLLENRLSEVRYELECYAAKLRVYDNQVAYSTVYLTVNEVIRTTPKDETLSEKMQSGFMDTVYEIKDGAAELAIWLVSNILYLLFWAVVIAVVIVVIRKQFKKAAQKRQERAAGQNVAPDAGQKENGSMGTKE